jgi:hypothetical protein
MRHAFLPHWVTWALSPALLIVFADVGPRCGPRPERPFRPPCKLAAPVAGLLDGPAFPGSFDTAAAAEAECSLRSSLCAGIQQAAPGQPWVAIQGDANTAVKGAEGSHQRMVCP